MISYWKKPFWSPCFVYRYFSALRVYGSDRVLTTNCIFQWQSSNLFKFWRNAYIEFYLLASWPKRNGMWAHGYHINNCQLGRLILRFSIKMQTRNNVTELDVLETYSIKQFILADIYFINIIIVCCKMGSQLQLQTSGRYYWSFSRTRVNAPIYIWQVRVGKISKYNNSNCWCLLIITDVFEV